jgi:type IV pilus assembly protein PilW
MSINRVERKMQTVTERPALLHKQAGMTLVELMVAVVLGLFLTWGAMQAFLSGKQAYSMQQSLSRIQENVRLAEEFIGFDIRSSGDYGCGSGDQFITVEGVADDVATCAANSTASTPGINALNTPGNIRYNFNYAVYGYDSTEAVAITALGLSPAALAGTDVLVVRPVVDVGGLTSATSPGSITSLAVNPTTGLAANDFIAVSDCAHARIYQISAVTATSVTLGGTTPGNRCTNEGAQYFELGASVRKLDTVFYYVANNGSARPALYRYSVSASLAAGAGYAAAELLEGVDNIQLQFGVDTNKDSLINVYRNPTAVSAAEWNGWDKDNNMVRSVRYSLVMRGEDAVLPDVQQYDVDGQTYYGGAATAAAGDRRLRQVMTGTVGIRSRVNPG